MGAINKREKHYIINNLCFQLLFNMRGQYCNDVTRAMNILERALKSQIRLVSSAKLWQWSRLINRVYQLDEPIKWSHKQEKPVTHALS